MIPIYPLAEEWMEEVQLYERYVEISKEYHKTKSDKDCIEELKKDDNMARVTLEVAKDIRKRTVSNRR